MPLLAHHLGLGELHLQGPPIPPDSGTFVRQEVRIGQNLSGTFQQTVLDLNRSGIATTAQLDTAGIHARVWIENAPARDDISLSEVLFQRRSVGPSALLEAGFGKEWWIQTRLQSLEGRPGWQLGLGHSGPGVEGSLAWEASKESEHWSFSLPDGEALETRWNSQQFQQSASLSLAPRTPFCLTGNWSHTSYSPESGAAYWNLTDSGSSHRWSVRWQPKWRTLRGELSHRAFQANLTTLGWGQDSGSERRRFHALNWTMEGFGQEATLAGKSASIRIGRQEATLTLTDLRAPFLAWNNLDNSPWGSLGALFETRQDRLQGTASLESQWAALEGQMRLGPFLAGSGIELTHLTLESALPWSRRKRSIDFSTSLETDTLRIRPLDAWVLWPSLRLALPRHPWDLSLSAVQALPLAIRQAPPPSISSSAAPSTNPSQTTARGGLAVRFALTRRL